MKIAILGAGIMGIHAYLFQLNLCVNKTLYYIVLFQKVSLVPKS